MSPQTTKNDNEITQLSSGDPINGNTPNQPNPSGVENTIYTNPVLNSDIDTTQSIVAEQTVSENITDSVQNDVKLNESSDTTNPQEVTNIQNVPDTMSTIARDPISEVTPNVKPSGPTQQPIPENEIPTTTQERNNSVENREGSKNTTLIFILFIATAVLALGGFYIYKSYSDKEEVVETFEECMAAKGSTVEESYPPICITEDGYEFTAEITTPQVQQSTTEPQRVTIEKPTAEKCLEEVSCSDDAIGSCLPNPASAFCVCMGGKTTIENSDDGSQFGTCTIDNEVYDEWDFYGMYLPEEKVVLEDETLPIESSSEVSAESPFEKITDLSYTLEKSEGVCTADSQCVWEDQGCGNGFGMCTDTPEKYAGIDTTCEIDPKFPATLGYTCGCIESVNKCGWEK